MSRRARQRSGRDPSRSSQSSRVRSRQPGTRSSTFDDPVIPYTRGCTLYRLWPTSCPACVKTAAPQDGSRGTYTPPPLRVRVPSRYSVYFLSRASPAVSGRGSVSDRASRPQELGTVPVMPLDLAASSTRQKTAAFLTPEFLFVPKASAVIGQTGTPAGPHRVQPVCPENGSSFIYWHRHTE